MKELKPSGLIAVPTEENSRDPFELLMSVMGKDDLVTQTECGYFIEIGSQKYQYIGWCTDDDISFDPSPYVQCLSRPMSMYRNYSHKSPYSQHQCYSPDASFRSLLTDNGVLFVNPYGDKPDITKASWGHSDIKQYREDLIEWQQAESQLVKKVLILKPINP